MPSRRVEIKGIVSSREVVAHVAFVGANLERVMLDGRDLSGINFSDANLRGASLIGANLRGAILVGADLSQASLRLADFEDADLSMADMSMSYCRAASFKNARMWFTSLRCCIAKNAYFIGADLMGADFVNSIIIGACFNDANMEHVRNWDRAITEWWWNPDGGPPSYDPVEGWDRTRRSFLGGISFPENAGKRAKR